MPRSINAVFQIQTIAVMTKNKEGSTKLPLMEYHGSMSTVFPTIKCDSGKKKNYPYTNVTHTNNGCVF